MTWGSSTHNSWKRGEHDRLVARLPYGGGDGLCGADGRTGVGVVETPLSHRVLVTGADGFIGSHLVERLVDDDQEVVALGAYNSEGSRGWLRDVPGAADVVLGDMRKATDKAANIFLIVVLFGFLMILSTLEPLLCPAPSGGVEPPPDYGRMVPHE